MERKNERGSSKKNAMSKRKYALESCKQSNILFAAESYLQENYCFRTNKVKSRVEFNSPNETGEWQPIHERELNTILNQMVRANIPYNKESLYTLLNSEFSPECDPLAVYFNNLTPWDGQTDHIAKLAETVNTTDQDFWDKAIRKWLVAMVGSVLNPSIVNHTVLILNGGQGIGKTTWLSRLIPVELNEYYYAGVIDPAHKDSLARLSTNMIVNMDELEGFNKREMSTLKEFITKKDIVYRKHYGRLDESFIRRASFCGSLNDKHFLSDTTGNRRFACFEVESINLDVVVSMSNVLSQAKALFESGQFQFWFDRDDIGHLEAKNNLFVKSSPEEDLLLSTYTPGTEGDADFMSASEIAIGLMGTTNGSIKVSPNILGKILTKHGFERQKGRGQNNNRYGYYVNLR